MSIHAQRRAIGEMGNDIFDDAVRRVFHALQSLLQIVSEHSILTLQYLVEDDAPIERDEENSVSTQDVFSVSRVCLAAERSAKAGGEMIRLNER